MHTNGLKIALCEPTQRVGFAICQALERLNNIAAIEVFIEPKSDIVRLPYQGNAVPVNDIKNIDAFPADVVIYAGKAFYFSEFYAKCKKDTHVINLSWGQDVEEYILSDASANIRQIKHPITQQIYAPLKHIDALSPIKSVDITVACGVDIAGEDGVFELMNQTRAYMNYDEEYFNVFPKPIAFNTISDIAIDETTGYQATRRLMSQELKQLFKQKMMVDMSFIQLPVMQGHHATIHVTTAKAIDLNDVSRSFMNDDSIYHVNMVSNREYGQCFSRAAVSQLNQHLDCQESLSFHVVADELAFGIQQFVVEKVSEMVEISGAI
tara:strand:+ start:481 stop:1449 length:969 start_codon:yes stop_codon:yes gene_type:complete